MFPIKIYDSPTHIQQLIDSPEVRAGLMVELCSSMADEVDERIAELKFELKKV